MEKRTNRHREVGPVRPTAVPASAPVNSAFMTVGGSRPSLSSKAPSCMSPQMPPLHVAGPSQAKRARKDRGPNWVPREVLFLIQAKRDVYLEELDAVDGRDLMTPDTTKWARISQQVMLGGASPCLRDAAACKTKWNQLIPDYKKIADYCSRTGRNVAEYWELTAAQHKAEGLPRLFSREFFDAIHEWFGNRPTIQPPHVRDLLSPSDGNFQSTPRQTTETDDDDESGPDPMDTLPLPMNVPLHCSSDNSTPPALRTSSTTSSRGAAAPATSNSQPFAGVPIGVVPHLLSSSNTTPPAALRRSGNTAVKRKNIAGHTVIAEATKATGAVMASQMQDIADASLEVERTKVDVQQLLFKEQMAYQRERDRRLHDTAAAANENARLAIQKQGEMVSCLAQLTAVLGRGLCAASSAEVHKSDALPEYVLHSRGISVQRSPAEAVATEPLSATAAIAKEACGTNAASTAEDLL